MSGTHFETITIRVEVPDGWAKTGEFRKPQRDDHFLASPGMVCSGRHSIAPTPRIILRKLPEWKAPPCFPKDSWLYKAGFDGAWYISKVEPQLLGPPCRIMGCWAAGKDVVVLDAKRFAEFYGQKFVEPTHTNKIHIK